MSNFASPMRRISNVFALSALATAAVRLAPGLAVAALIACLAYLLRQLPGLGNFSPMIIAILIGILVRNTLGTHAVLTPGIGFSMRRLLRAAIILLGLQLTFAQVAATGLNGVAIIVATVLSTFVFTLAVGRLLGVEARLTQIIATGTSICGASAAAAAGAVVAADDEDIAYAVACVTVFGSIAMFAYPMLADPLGLGPRDFGLWAGASIHEIAQVVAATFTVGREAGEFGTVAKLTRVMLLAPMVFTMAAVVVRRQSGVAGVKPPLPWFVAGFIALVAINSLIALPITFKQDVGVLSTFLLTMALAAMGLETSLVKLKARGLRPALLGAIASLFIASFSLMLIKLT